MSNSWLGVCTRPAKVVAGLIWLTVLLSVALVGSAEADTESELEAARRRVADAQAEANAAAADITQAMGRFEALDAEIARLETVISDTRHRADLLRAIVRERALAAYTRHTGSDFDVVLSAENPLDAARRSTLLDHANQKDNDDVSRLAALRDELHEQRQRVERQREEQRQVKEALDQKYVTVRAALADASRARDALAAKLEHEEAEAAAAAELARLRAIQAAAQVAPASSDGGRDPSPGRIIANPGGGPFQCPVSGSAYGNSYGPRGDGFHFGIDMMAPTGTPLVAVKSGAIGYVPNGGAGGNEAYLSASDGNVYYYAHLSQFAGGARSVSQGEVIGLVGSTGRSSTPHLHFEIRIGGANGQRINPYATLQSAGC